MIKIDIEMPKTCNGCFAAHWDDNTNALCAIEADRDSDDDVLIYTDILHYMYHGTKPDWCPIKEVLTGEWIDKGDYAECSICGAHSGTQFDGVEPIPLKTNFCPNCGRYMGDTAKELEEVK